MIRSFVNSFSLPQCTLQRRFMYHQVKKFQNASKFFFQVVNQFFILHKNNFCVVLCQPSVYEICP